MRAMQLVSGSKLKRAQGRLLQARAVLGFLDGLLERLLSASPGLQHALCRPSNKGSSLLVLCTSDAGLCGSYNANLIQLAESYLRRDTRTPTKLVYIGKKGYRHLTKRGYPALESYLDLAGRPNLQRAEAIGRALMGRFLSGEASSVHLLYSEFTSPTVYRPTVIQWLPIQLQTPDTRHQTPVKEYLFEPSAEQVFEDLLPRWALAKFQLVMLEAFTSEHSARMIAMKNATDNAEEILKSLTLQRNKIRQAAITKELSEIVGTAEALK
jgi:F-type H+-transporting ATPase subunit gamma